jgi:hypothetical protein
MPTDTKKTDDGRKGPDLSALFALQKSVNSMVRSIPEAALDAAGDEPDAALIRSNVEMVGNMFEKGFAKMAAEMKRSNSVNVEEALEFLEATDVTNFVQRTEKTAVTAFRSKLFGGNIWQWLGQNLTEIKKIIGMILGFISKKLKAWWNKFEPIIDQFWDLIMSLFGGIFGLNRREIARDLSYAHVNYLNEMAAHAKLMNATTLGDDSDDD